MAHTSSLGGSASLAGTSARGAAYLSLSTPFLHKQACPNLLYETLEFGNFLSESFVVLCWSQAPGLGAAQPCARQVSQTVLCSKGYDRAYGFRAGTLDTRHANASCCQRSRLVLCVCDRLQRRTLSLNCFSKVGQVKECHGVQRHVRLPLGYEHRICG